MLAGPTSRACVIEFEQGHAHVSVALSWAGVLAGVTPNEYLRSRIDGPTHLRVAASWP